MDFEKYDWYKPNWQSSHIDAKQKKLLIQCIELPDVEISDDVEALILRSNDFPVKFPIESVRMKTLKQQRPMERLRKNIVSTYPLIHERSLLLMTKFLIHKREYGSNIEKILYKNMTLPQFIDRLLLKRAVNFMGPKDKYRLITGETGADGWEQISTPEQKTPLVLDSVISYDEIKLSAMLYVSGHTEFINDGARKNKGVVGECEPNGVIIGLIGPRFKRRNRMDCEDIIVSKEHNCFENGYALETSSVKEKRQKLTGEVERKHEYRKMWSDFFQIPNYTYEDLTAKEKVEKKKMDSKDTYTARYVPLARGDYFDNTGYFRRIIVPIDTALLEANDRAKQGGKEAFLNMVGLGLGVWKISGHQVDVFVLACIERTKALLEKRLVDHVTHFNLAYIMPTETLLKQFTKCDDNHSSIFIQNSSHPKGGVKISLESREPASVLNGEWEGKLLVTTYPWDGNAQPGNEFWIGKLASSGDPAAACSSQVSELHNPFIHPALCGARTKVATENGLFSLKDYCRQFQ